MLNNNTLLANPFVPVNPITLQMKNTLGLNQIDGFKPVEKFTDDTNTEWSLAKASNDSTVDIPDPKALQITDFWNHEFPKPLKNAKLYIYVVEGIRQPRVETEQPTRVLYQWFSTIGLRDFTPAMISEKEWLKANVYSAPVVNARVSKLIALCQVPSVSSMQNGTQEDKLIQVEELTNESDTGDTSKVGEGK